MQDYVKIRTRQGLKIRDQCACVEKHHDSHRHGDRRLGLVPWWRLPSSPESIFAWPGTGKLLIDSINQLDRPVIVAYLLVIATLFVVINFVVDLAYSWLDPRVRLGAGGALMKVPGVCAHSKHAAPDSFQGPLSTSIGPGTSPGRHLGGTRNDRLSAAFRSGFAESKIALAALVLLAIIVCVAPLRRSSPRKTLRSHPTRRHGRQARAGEKSMAGKTHWLGTDDQGCDMLSGIFMVCVFCLPWSASTLIAVSIGLHWD